MATKKKAIVLKTFRPKKETIVLVRVNTNHVKEDLWYHNMKGRIFAVVKNIDRQTGKIEPLFWQALYANYLGYSSSGIGLSPNGMLPNANHISPYVLQKKHCEIVGKYKN